MAGILSILSPFQRSRIRGWYKRARNEFVRRFRSYDAEDLKAHLARIGIRSGDTLLVHTAYGPHLGFQGSPNALIDVFVKAVGPGGNLLMVSMPYFSSAGEYLKSIEFFDVRKTVSKMGLISEAFRRMPGVRRSLNPTNPVLAYGPKAEWIVSNHENCLYPCGPASPFEKLLELHGKVLFFGVNEFHFTFHHYLEHMVKDEVPFKLYEDEPYGVKVIDYDGEIRRVQSYVFTREVISRRRVNILFDELARRGQLQKTRIGNTHVVQIDLSDSVVCTQDMARKGIYFYDLSAG